MSAQKSHSKIKLIAWLVVVLCISYIAYALAEPLSALKANVSFSFYRPAQAVSIDWPSYGESAIGAVGYNVLATHGANTPLPTASVAKMVTALAVLKQEPLSLNQSGPIITLNQADLDSYNKYVAEDGSVVKVAVGEQITEYQALQAMLLPSANNIAETLARWAFGSISAYNNYANSFVRQLGMNDTTITDPSGFLPTTVSTPHDLILLGQAALANPVIAQIMDQRSATIPVQGMITNVNSLLGYNGIVGIKTGNNNQDLGCYLFASRQQIDNKPITIIGAVMGGPSLDATMLSSLPIINSATKDFSPVTIANAGANVGSLSVPWSQPVKISPVSNLSVLLWNNSTTSASVEIGHDLKPPKANQTIVGDIKISNSAASSSYLVPLKLDQAIYAPNLIWRLSNSL